MLRRQLARFAAKFRASRLLHDKKCRAVGGDKRLCGKFTRMASWEEVVAFSRSLVGERDANDRVETYRPMSLVPITVFDPVANERMNIRMRWGFPDPQNPMRPNPIHARCETIDVKPTFKNAFVDGQRGVLFVKTFNEGKEITPKKTEQHTVTPNDGQPLAIACLWRRWEFEPPLLAFVMVTTPPNKLISTITDRMPAVIRNDDISKWLGETPAGVDELKAMLTVHEGDWSMGPEPMQNPRPRPRKPEPPEQPPGLF